MAFQQGTIILASDPFKDDSGSVRPFVVLNTAKHPFHGRQYMVMTVSTQEYDDGIELDDSFLAFGDLDRRSFALPWSITSVPASEVYEEVARLKEPVIEVLLTELVSYIAPDFTATPDLTADA